MSAKNIAFAGSIKTGKSSLQEKALELLGDVPKVGIGNNVEDNILDTIDEKYSDYFAVSDEIELASTFSRRVQMLSVDPNMYIVSDEWALNDLARTMVKMGDLQRKLASQAQILGPSGDPVVTAEHGRLVIIQSIFQVIVNQVAAEQDFWDFMYYTPIYEPGDDTLVEDGVKPKDRLYQKELDLALSSLATQLNLKVVVLPAEQEAAFKFLEDESRKWTE